MHFIKTIFITKPVIRLSFYRLVIFSLSYSIAATFVLWAIHQVNFAGPIFAPLYFLVPLISLLFGWRAGVLVGFFLPVFSYYLSGMPVLSNLPIVLSQSVAYGFFSGYAVEKLKFNVWVALLASLIVARFIGSLVLFTLKDIDILMSFLQSFKVGWPGIALQAVFIIPLVNLASKWINSEN
jgi:hypothetical protein